MRNKTKRIDRAYKVVLEPHKFYGVEASIEIDGEVISMPRKFVELQEKEFMRELKRKSMFTFSDCGLIPGVEVEIEVLSYTPERPAPYCSNPDSPSYSDCGDDPEGEYRAFILIGTHYIEFSDDMYDEYDQEIFGMLEEHGNDYLEGQYQDAMEQQAEMRREQSWE